ncbi:hypothetical protein C900_02601 [Fulvivirga imtechensis AK7]|uniref:2-oxoadipate dioxygenase/decarboxylase n=1 Tax=Fulvivirga imtechensis AK7 TaxID=1237149 RepID=L8JTH0_9BACT|nr:DUF1338 domain-containing protein [Fulvivirga imtechensis]ELR71538.1 hypothetical protein C900_02601 [Fulvivirga imtechensis AK7]
MNFDKNSSLDKILNALFVPYKESVPEVKKISDAMIINGMISDESDIINDHIAFRTLGVSHLGISSFEKIFLHYGYKRRDPYYFAEKKLNAFWYEPPTEKYPRIFISELRVHDLSLKAQSIISKYVASIQQCPVESINLDNSDEVGAFFYKPLWDLPILEDYQTLLQESEYAAWVIYNRYYLNHYTISIHELPEGYNTLEEFNTFLESIGIILNTSGGKIKTSEDGLLRQSSSVSKMQPATFAGGETMKISGSYVEFAERSVLPQFRNLPKDKITRAHRRDGFESANADKIFESTYLEQTSMAVC